MSLPGIAALVSYGGALNDYSPPVDATTDRSAAGANPAYADAAAMTHTIQRVWVKMTLSSSAPVLVAWDATWQGNVLNAAPVLARSTTGVNTITLPTSVFDEIPAGLPGYNAAGITLNLRFAWGQDLAAGAALWHVRAVVTSANVITVYTWNSGGSLADMGSLGVNIFAG